MSSFLDGRILKIMQRRYKFEQLPFASLGTERKDGREGDGSLPGLCRGPQLGSKSDRKTRLHLFTAPKLKRCHDLQITVSLFYSSFIHLLTVTYLNTLNREYVVQRVEKSEARP